MWQSGALYVSYSVWWYLLSARVYDDGNIFLTSSSTWQEPAAPLKSPWINTQSFQLFMGRSCESHGPKTAILKDVTNHSNGYSTDMSVYLHVVACMYIYIYIIIVEIHSKYIYMYINTIWCSCTVWGQILDTSSPTGSLFGFDSESSRRFGAETRDTVPI